MYLHIDEDGTLSQQSDAPDGDTLHSIDIGCLNVVRFNPETNKFEDCQPDGSWQEV